MKKTVCNPYLPSYEYIPDGEPHVFGDRLYIFGSHDRFGGAEFCMNDYVCWSTPVDDLSDWRYEGVIYRRTQDPTPIAPGQHHMWAPDVTEGPDGRFYLYYAMEWLNRIGVAVCDTPAGEYRYLGEVHYPDGTRYGGREGELLRFDPGLLNDEGRIYLYTGFSLPWKRKTWHNPGYICEGTGSRVVELAQDMLTVLTEPRPLLPGRRNSRGTGFEGHEFFEAASMRKIDGRYYAVYSSFLSRELCWAVSDYPDRDFTYGGTLLDNSGSYHGSRPTFFWGNNHGSLVRIGDQFYVFGHRQTYRNEFSRQGIAEPVAFKDGKFGQAELTSQGLYGKPLPCKGEYEASAACVLHTRRLPRRSDLKGADEPYITQDGPDRECDPGQYVTQFGQGAVCGYKYFDLEGKKRLTLTVRRCGSLPVLGRVEVSLSHDFKKPVRAGVRLDGEDAAPVPLTFTLRGEGKSALYIRFIGSGTLDLLTLSWDAAADDSYC